MGVRSERVLLPAVLFLAACTPSKPEADGGTGGGGGTNHTGNGGATNFTVDPSCQVVDGVDRAAVLMAAFPEAVRLAQSGGAYFDNAAMIGPAPYERWFGPVAQIVPDLTGPYPERPKVQEHVRTIAHVIVTWQFVIICQPMNAVDQDGKVHCKDPHSYAWVDTGRDQQNPYRINLCPQFFSMLTSTGINSQASTLAHEVSHFSWNINNEAGAGLEDEIDPLKFGYDVDKFAVYSTSNPSPAVKDSYTHEFFLGSDPGNH